MNSNVVLLRAEKITKVYREYASRVQILEEVDLFLKTGTFAAITGASGSGKTTLLHILSGLEWPTTGCIFWKNESMAHWSAQKMAQHRNQNIGFIYQKDHLLAAFNALENVALPARIRGDSRSVAHERAKRLLVQVGLGGKEFHYPYMLSGGERQRVSIARSLINEPELVFADEPTGNLDYANALRIFELLVTLQQQRKMTCLLVTHDQSLAARCHQHWHLKAGKVYNHLENFPRSPDEN